MNWKTELENWFNENIGKTDTIENSLLFSNLCNLCEYIYQVGRRDMAKKLHKEEGAWIDLLKQMTLNKENK